jgi:hypothetical protein
MTSISKEVKTNKSVEESTSLPHTKKKKKERPTLINRHINDQDNQTKQANNQKPEYGTSELNTDSNEKSRHGD